MRVRTGYVSTISYNSEAFLINKLNELAKNHVISDYMFIRHLPEEDERKDHIHLVLKPNKRIDTMEIQEFLTELVPEAKKPLKCIDFHKTSDLDEWILYELHHQGYLLSKGESRKYVYNKDDFRYYDEDTFEYNYYHAFHASKWAYNNQIMRQIRENIINPVDLIYNNTVSLKDAGNLLAMQRMHRTYRGYHEGHELAEEIKDIFEKQKKIEENK